jgi:hypothetical protein
VQDFGNLTISLAFIGKEQNPGSIELTCGVFSAPDEIQQVCSFFFC